MPILLQEVRRRQPLRRKRFLGVPPAYLVYAAVCSGILAGWLFRAGGGLLPARTATIIVTPQTPRDEASAGRPGQEQRQQQRQEQGQARQASRPFATAGRTIAPQPELDRNPVGTIPTPSAPAQPFSEVERVAPEKYTGFRVVTPPR